MYFVLFAFYFILSYFYLIGGWSDIGLVVVHSRARREVGGAEGWAHQDPPRQYATWDFALSTRWRHHKFVTSRQCSRDEGAASLLNGIKWEMAEFKKVGNVHHHSARFEYKQRREIARECPESAHQSESPALPAVFEYLLLIQSCPRQGLGQPRQVWICCRELYIGEARCARMHEAFG